MEQLKRDKRREKQASLALLGASLIWGVGFIFTKMALDAGLSVAACMAARFLLAALLVGVFFHRRLRRHYIKGQWKAGLVMGSLLFLGFYVQTLGLEHTTPANNAFITAVYVVLVPFLWWVVSKKRPGPVVFVACGMCLVGVGVLSLDPAAGFMPGLGEALTLLSAVFYAAHIVATALMAKTVHPTVLVFMQLAVAAGWSLLAFLFSGPSLAAFASVQGSLSILYLAVFSTFLCYFLQTMGQRWVSSAKAGILLATESLFGSLASVLLGYDPFSWRMVLGGLLIFASVVLPELPALLRPGPGAAAPPAEKAAAPTAGAEETPADAGAPGLEERPV